MSSKPSSKSKTPTLDHFSRDITQLAKKGKLDPVIGRESEIERVAQILTRRKKNNPVLIGEPGVGKTAIIEGLAQMIIRKTVPRILHNQRILSLDLAAIVAGAKYRGQFEERLKSVMVELEMSENVIILLMRFILWLVLVVLQVLWMPLICLNRPWLGEIFIA